MNKFESLTILGSGYVGLSLACLLGRNYNINLVDIDKNKVDIVNKKLSPLRDDLIEEFLLSKNLNIRATTKIREVAKNTDLYVLALPTNYDELTGKFDTSILEKTISKISSFKEKPPILIKSTVPVGFTERMNKEYPSLRIIFSPEFLREGSALYDNLYPSRIVMGDKGETSKGIANLFLTSCLNEPQCLYMSSKEAESVKLFSNSYLALRVSFFNELDSYCLNNDIDTKQIIDAVCLDSRIGQGYNNPSFGYGGYCLPKDTKQLLQNYGSIPQTIISSIVEANDSRLEAITDHILTLGHKKLGIYRLIMKGNSDNMRESAVLKLIKLLATKRIKIDVFEPLIEDTNFSDFNVVADLNEFKKSNPLIIANRLNLKDLGDVLDKVYTRDIFGDN